MLKFAGFHARLCRLLLAQMLSLVADLEPAQGGSGYVFSAHLLCGMPVPKQPLFYFRVHSVACCPLSPQFRHLG